MIQDKKNLNVVAGIIRNDSNRILCCQRRNKGELAYKWEFPGGKVEENETNQEALRRELQEELDIESVIGDFVMTVKHEYNTFNLIMHVYDVESYHGEIILIEHLDMKWLVKEDLHILDWAEADVPIIEKLKG